MRLLFLPRTTARGLTLTKWQRRVCLTVAGTVALAVVGTTCAPPTLEPDPRLLEAIAWYTGLAGRVDDARAHALLDEAAADRGALSLMWLARVHSRGRMGFEEDQALARLLAESVIDEVARAADAGQLEAVFLMGTANDEGLGREEDPVLATEWHRRAAEGGHALGQHNLGNAYAQGRGVEADDSLAVFWWRKAAERGDAITQLRLGEAYEAGRGVPRNDSLAAMWFTRAAESGNQTAATARLRGVS